MSATERHREKEIWIIIPNPGLSCNKILKVFKQSRVAMAEWLACRTPNHNIVGLSPAEATWLIKTVLRGLRVTTMVPLFTQP